MAEEYRATLALKKHIGFVWRVIVSRPPDWIEPADPHSLDRADLERLTDADYLTIAMYRLGGLADVGALRPLVLQPTPTSDVVRDMAAYSAWRGRFPINDDDRSQKLPPLNVRALPPEAAEEMLEDVIKWAKREATGRGESLCDQGPLGPHAQNSAIKDHDEYRPAAWFKNKIAARLRMAASPKRKSKRVATREIDGVRCYRVLDVRQWWPKDVPTDRA